MKKRINAIIASVLCLTTAAVMTFTGCAGQTGAQGPQGEQGIQGEQGPAGPQGPAGADANSGDEYVASGDISETLKEATGTVSGDLSAKGVYYADYRTREEAHAAGEKLNTEMRQRGLFFLKTKIKRSPFRRTKQMSRSSVPEA